LHAGDLVVRRPGSVGAVESRRRVADLAEAGARRRNAREAAFGTTVEVREVHGHVAALDGMDHVPDQPDVVAAVRLVAVRARDRHAGLMAGYERRRVAVLARGDGAMAGPRLGAHFGVAGAALSREPVVMQALLLEARGFGGVADGTARVVVD